MTPAGTSAPFKHPDQLFIDGRWVTPASPKKIAVINSSTEELFVSVAEAQEADVKRAVAAARRAFDQGSWPRLSHAERAKYLKAIAREIEIRADDLALIWTTESGVTHGAAKAVGPSLPGVWNYYADLAETYPFVEKRKPESGNVGLLMREPVGVVAVIIPWNAPPLSITYKVAPALLAGCTVVLKPAPEAPGAAYVLAEICEKIGLPPGVVNLLTADRSPAPPRPGGASVRFVASASRVARSSSAANRRPSSWMTTTSALQRRRFQGWRVS